MSNAGIIGVGKALPDNIVTNDDLVKRGIDTSDEWIRTRSGIHERRIADDQTSTSDLATEAARQAIEDSGLSKDDIELIIVATTSQDYPGFPSVGCLV